VDDRRTGKDLGSIIAALNPVLPCFINYSGSQLYAG